MLQGKHRQEYSSVFTLPLSPLSLTLHHEVEIKTRLSSFLVVVLSQLLVIHHALEQIAATQRLQ